MQKMNYWERFRSEKLRKMFFDCMPWPDYGQFLPDFARFMIDGNQWPGNSPQMVSLIHNHCPTPQPDPDHWIKRCDLPEHTEQTTYYVYSTPTEDRK
jgi:hypothetical protein